MTHGVFSVFFLKLTFMSSLVSMWFTSCSANIFYCLKTLFNTIQCNFVPTRCKSCNEKGHENCHPLSQ